MREVKEEDFRKKDFRDAKVEDYEFRGDGEVVRKDRWETGIRNIKNILDDGHGEFEIDDIIESVKILKDYKMSKKEAIGS